MALALLQEMRLGGLMGDRVHALTTQWLLPAPGANPGIYDVYARRDRPLCGEPSSRDGEYLGKYLTGAILLFRMHREHRLRAVIESLLFRLYDAQEEDGYLGVLPAPQREKGRCDLWNHYQAMMALYLWYKTTNSLKALERLTRAANYLCARLGAEDGAPLKLEDPPRDLALMHALALIYRATGEKRYFSLWKRLSAAFARLEGQEDWFALLDAAPLSGLPVSDATLLYAIDSLYTLHHMTGQEGYARALYGQYRRLRLTSRMPNGGYGHAGRSADSPYGPYAPETCSTVAWIQLCTDTLRAVRKASIADELELTTFNAALSALHPSGRYALATAPMTGCKRPAGTGDLAGAPEFTCCSADAPRALGMLSQWGVFADGEEVYLSYYGAGSIVLQLDTGRLVHITQTTDYPRSGRIQMTVTTQRAVTLHLRIPAWSRDNTLSVDGRAIYDTVCGEFYPLPLPAGTVSIELELDLKLHYWEGDGPALGRHALYRGPLLLAFDRHHNPDWPHEDVPALDYANMRGEIVQCGDAHAPLLLMRFSSHDGAPVYLCDYASAGLFGSPIQSWLPIRRAPAGSVWR